MASLPSTAPRREDEPAQTGGPIGALVIAIPLSLLLWSGLMYVLFQLIH